MWYVWMLPFLFTFLFFIYDWIQVHFLHFWLQNVCFRWRCHRVALFLRFPFLVRVLFHLQLGTCRWLRWRILRPYAEKFRSVKFDWLCFSRLLGFCHIWPFIRLLLLCLCHQKFEVTLRPAVLWVRHGGSFGVKACHKIFESIL